jgi:hypothetical protein
MEKQGEKSYFDADSLKKLIAAEGKEVKAIVCYLWQNSINANDVVELIDNFEIRFTDGYKLTLGSNPDNTGLEAVDFDYEAEKKAIEEEFNGKIKMYGVNASATKMWKDVIGLKLHSIKLTKEENNYLSDSVMLDFGEERRTIAISPLDGLIIDFYED